jgi:hypothetical protein
MAERRKVNDPSELWPIAAESHFSPLRTLRIRSRIDPVETTDAQDIAPLSARVNVLIGHLHSLLLGGTQGFFEEPKLRDFSHMRAIAARRLPAIDEQKAK